MKSYLQAILVVLLLVTCSCSAMKSLRQEAYEDELTEQEYLAHRYANRGKNAFRRKPLPPPATVLDRNLTEVQGTPIDLSGVRAKSGRVTRQDFEVAAARNENSLWKEDGQNNFFFANNKLKLPGDLLTIEVEKDLKKDLLKEYVRAVPEDDRYGLRVPGLTPEGPTSVASKAKSSNESGSNEDAAKPDASDANQKVASTDGASQDQNAQNREPAALDPNSDLLVSDAPYTMTAEVVQRYPNGNLLIRGIKRIPFKNQVRSMEVSAIVRGSDVTEEGAVKSSRFFESKVEAYR